MAIKFTAALAVLVLGALICSTEAGCQFKCSWRLRLVYSNGWRYVHRFVCGWVCGFSGKRSLVPSKNLTEEPMPCKFANYDIDNSGGIDLKEFAEALDMKEDEVKTAFKLADKNNDNTLSCIELLQGPFTFKCRVVCPESPTPAKPNEGTKTLV